MEIFMKKEKNSIYVNRFWYLNTYKSLGSHWLIKSIEKLNPKKNYVFINLSANAGYYEKDVYEKHFSQYDPIYHIGDIEASKLKDKKVDSFKQFNYIQGDNNAVTMDVSIIPDKADILMDCKGALWHTIADKKSDKEQLIHLLENYSKLLNDSGVLLMDYYKTTYFKFFFQNLKWTFKRYNKKPTFINCFGELSTYSYLVDLYGRKTINALLNPLNIKEKFPYFPLSKIMDTAYISKDDLDKLIEITKNTPKWNFAFAKFKRLIKTVFLFLVTITAFLFIMILLILDNIFIVSAKSFSGVTL